ncbi:hypothetical protein [Nonlabens xiamenensis]|uniref:hypothetical protein n=1 Tax=Nonlabens xiamenensis TaxID=2341043 RepID=UPI000F6075C6|nr:hypothetical protein [Nonlabens xiamenensis]
MAPYKIHQYNSSLRQQWDDFILTSANGTFIWERDFMEYHQDRFQDHSLMIYKGDRLLACMPAHVVDGSFYSHRGLTYGGVAWENSLSSLDYLLVYQHILDYLKTSAFAKAEIQLQSPWYHSKTHEEYEVLTQLGFNLQRKQHSMWVKLSEKLVVSSKKTAGYRNGKFDNMKFSLGSRFEQFWEQVLIPSLQNRHKARPVHSAKEICHLYSKFPEQILLFQVIHQEELVAGICFFLKGNVVKSQYAAATTKGMKQDAMAFAYIESMKYFAARGFEIMDYGPVNESNGSINRGLQRFKEELGCTTTVVSRLEKQLQEDVE